MKMIPSHVINADNKRKQRRTYMKITNRAGFRDPSRNSLSCIGPENENPQTKQSRHSRHINNNSKNSPGIPWLGAASKSLLSSIESSRLYDIFARPIKQSTGDQASKKDNNDGEKPMTKKISNFLQSEKLRNINATIAAGSMGQSMFKTTISEGFGKLIYPNGTVYIGQWDNDIPHGYGKALYAAGASYEGVWNNGNREGKGKLIFSDGIGHYEGEFLNGKFHGEGKYTSHRLGVAEYNGHFSSGNVYGEYSVCFTDGEKIKRSWPDARLTLHEAINKLMKEKDDRNNQRRRRSSVKVQFHLKENESDDN